jgi:hypothetical protein
MTPSSSPIAWTRIGFLTVLAAATVLVYLPGLSGPFVFDDFGSLSRLGDFGGVRDWPTFRAFVLGGDAGPTGRPLALLTFLIDGSGWPTDAWPFKRTNLVIHILTGAALFLVARQMLGLLAFPAERAFRIAAFAAAAWLLHPFLVSTTLYAVQRMAQLAAFFCLAGLAVYLRGRILLAERPATGYLMMTTGIGAGTLLAVLCKENGVLLPLLAIVLEGTIVASSRPPLARPHRLWTIVILGLPVLAVAAYLANYVVESGLFTTNLTRGYSIYERLLTQPRVLTDYVLHWFFPQPATSGVFQDHVRPSTALLSPLSTLAALLLHTVALSAAIALRRRLPLAAFGLLFFYAAHLLESSAINLELYFEHRNYLAAAFLFLPVIAYLDGFLARRFLFAGIGAWLILLGGFTLNSANVWSSYPSMVRTAAMSEPDSARAQQQFAVQLFNAGDPTRALEVIAAAIQRQPDNQSLHLTGTIIRCEAGVIDGADVDRLTDVVGQEPYDPRLLGTYETLFSLVARQACPPFAVADFNSLFERMLEEPSNADPSGIRYFQIQYFLGLADIRMQNVGAGEEHLRNSLAARPTANRAMLMASLMANAEAYEAAMRFTEDALRRAGDDSGAALAASDVSRDEILDFQNRLRTAMSTGAGSSSENAGDRQ